MNTVMGMTERQFCEMWVVTLSMAMLKTGKGFRVNSPNRRPSKGASGWHGERRADKQGVLGSTKLARRLQKPAVQA
jgi:hypothetical protein